MIHPTREQGLPPGTVVLTPSGAMPVERLAPGDLVVAVSGVGAPFQPVIALHRRILPAALVRLRAGALGEDVPREDLLLPPGHGVLVDGALVAAGALLGGPGAVLEQSAGMQDVLGLVLPIHDAVLVAGVAVETALPSAEARPCAPWTEPDAALRAWLAWRAEAMGWLPPLVAGEEDPAPTDLPEELAASPLAPARRRLPPVG